MRRFLLCWVTFCVLALSSPAAQVPLSVGAAANDKTGDGLRTSFLKIETNVTALFNQVYTNGVTKLSNSWSVGTNAYVGPTRTTNGGYFLQHDGAGGLAWAGIAIDGLLTHQTYAALRASQLQGTNIVKVLGRSAPGDGGEGDFVWVAGSTTPDDGGMFLAPSVVSGGVWARVTDGPIRPNWYGATATGSADSLAAFTAAIAAASSSTTNKVVEPYPGIYKFSSSIGMSGLSGITLQGSGVTLSNTFGTGSLLSISGGCTNLTISGIKIVGHGTGAFDRGINVASSCGLTIRGVEITQCNEWGIVVGGAVSSLTSAPILIQDCEIVDNGGGISLTTAQYANVIGCTITLNGVNYGAGADAGTMPVKGCGVYGALGNDRLDNNIIQQNLYGVYLDSSSGTNPDHSSIANNQINHNQALGLYVANITNAVQILNNEILSTVGPAVWPPLGSSVSVALYNSPHIGFTGNTVDGGTANQVRLDAVSQSIFSANHFWPSGNPTEVTACNDNQWIGNTYLTTAARVPHVSSLRTVVMERAGLTWNGPSSQTYTWTGGGTFIGNIKTITDTSSSGTSQIDKYVVSGTEVYGVRKDGYVFGNVFAAGTALQVYGAYGGSGNLKYNSLNSGLNQYSSDAHLGWYNNANIGSGSLVLDWKMQDTNTFAITDGASAYKDLQLRSTIQTATAAPAVSSGLTMRTYFDSTANKWKVSENGGGYVSVIPTDGAIGFGNVDATQFQTNGSVLSIKSAAIVSNLVVKADGSSNAIVIVGTNGVAATIVGPNGGIAVGSLTPAGPGNITAATNITAGSNVVATSSLVGAAITNSGPSRLSGNVILGTNGTSAILVLANTSGSTNIYIQSDPADANYSKWTINTSTFRLGAGGGSINFDAAGAAGGFAFSSSGSGFYVIESTKTYPATTAGMSLGDSTHRWKDIWLGGNTVTASTPLINGSQTWNNSGVTFTGALINITDTASATASLLQDWQVAGVSKASIRKDGAVQSLYDRYGSGSPEGVVAAPVGAVYHRTDGSTGTAVYFKETGTTTSSGWVAK